MAIRIPVTTSAFRIAVGFTVLDCASCALAFAVTDEFDQRRRYDGNKFYCPLGHSNAYDSTDSKLRNELAETKKKLEASERRVSRLGAEIDQVEAEKTALARSRSAIQGQLTKTRRRITNGVCPDCNRTFANVARHMLSKHAAEVS